MKTLPTNKKFYNKWIYKVSVNTDLSTLFRVYTLEELRDICEHDDNKLTRKWWGQNVKENKHRIMPIVRVLEAFDLASYATRVEHRQLDFYTNDKGMYDTLSQEFESQIIHRFEPSADVNLDQAHVIVSKKLPHDRYQYRVYLQPHKLKGDVVGKEKYLEWLDGQDKILVSAAVKRWFMKTDWNWDRRYILVEDEPTLLMLKLRSNDIMGTVYTYVISDK